MGNSHKKPQQYDFVNHFLKEDWIRQQDIGKSELWRNLKTNQLAEAYKLATFPSSEDFERYEFRHNNHKDIVKVFFVDIQKSKNICSGNDQAIVLTQHITVRLDQQNNLSLVQGFSILKSAYSGFNIITSFYGPIHIDQSMIGFNGQGRTKVWLNNNYSKNYAESNASHTNDNLHQIDRVGNNDNQVQHLFQIVEERIVGKKFPNKFRQGIYGNKFNYFQASNYVYEFCQNQRIICPQQIKFTKHVKTSNGEKPTSGNLVQNYRVQQNNFTLAKSSSMNSLGTQIRYQTLNTEYKSMIPIQSNTNLNQNMHRNVLFGNRKVNVTFGSPNIPRNQAQVSSAAKIVTMQNRQSLPNLHQPFRIINQQPPLRQRVLTSNIQTTPKYVGNNLKFTSPGKITQFQQPIYRQAHQQKKIEIIKPEITESQDIKIQNAQVQKYHQSQEKAQQINELHKYLDRQVLKFPHQTQFQMSNSFGVNMNTKKFKQVQMQQSNNNDLAISSQMKSNYHEHLKHYQENQSDQGQEEVHANQYHQHIREPAHQCYEQDQYLDQGEYQHKMHQEEHGLNQYEKELHQQYSEQNDYQQPHQENNDYHQEETEVTGHGHREEYINEHEQQQHAYQLQHQNEGQQQYHHHDQQHQRQYNHYGNQPHDEQQQPDTHYQMGQNQLHYSNNHQNYISSQEIIPAHEPQQQNQYYYNQFKKYAAPSGPSSPSHMKHTSNYQNQQAFKFSSKSSTNREIQAKSSGTLVVHQSQQNLYNVANNLSKNVLPNHSNQYKQVDSEGEEQENQQRVFKQVQSQKSNDVPAEKLHYRQQSDELVQYTPVDSIFKKDQPRQTDQINRLDRPEDIQRYIKNKYKDYIGQEAADGNLVYPNIQRKTSQTGRTLTFARQPENPHPHSYHQFATNVESKYQIYETFAQNQSSFGKPVNANDYMSKYQNREEGHIDKSQNDEIDFLDIKHLEKSLDNKYSKLSNQQILKAKKSQTSEEGFDVASLQKKLQKFQQNRQSQGLAKSSQYQKSEELFREDNIIQMMDRKIQQSQRKQSKPADVFGNVKLEESVSGSFPFTQIPVLTTYQVSSRQNSKQATGRQVSINNKLSGMYDDSMNFSETGVFKKNNSSAYNTYNNSYTTETYTSPLDNYNTTTYQADYKYANFKKKPSIKNIELDYDVSGYDQSSRRSSRRQSAKDALKLASQIQNKYQKYVKKSSNSHIQSSLDSINIKSKYDTSYASDTDYDKYAIKQKTLNRKQSPSYLKTINEMMNPSLDQSPIKQNENFNKSNQFRENGYHLDLKSYGSNESKSKENSKKSIQQERKPSSRVSYDQLRSLLWK